MASDGDGVGRRIGIFLISPPSRREVKCWRQTGACVMVSAPRGGSGGPWSIACCSVGLHRLGRHAHAGQARAAPDRLMTHRYDAEEAGSAEASSERRSNASATSTPSSTPPGSIPKVRVQDEGEDFATRCGGSTRQGALARDPRGACHTSCKGTGTRAVNLGSLPAGKRVGSNACRPSVRPSSRSWLLTHGVRREGARCRHPR